MESEITHLRERLTQLKRLGYNILRERYFALAKVDFKKGKAVLEIGTGRGYMALVLARKGLALTSIDRDRKIVQAAKNILKYYGMEKLVVLKPMNAQHLRFKNLSFDYVLAVNFIHHAQKPVRCIEEMIRVARQKIMIVDVNKRGAEILERLHAAEGHIHERSRIEFHEIKKLFLAAGMKVKTYRSRCQTVIVAGRG